MEVGVYGDFEIAGKMLEEHAAKGQQISVEVFSIKICLIRVIFKLKWTTVKC